MEKFAGDSLVPDLIEEWGRHLRSRNRAPRTIESYVESAQAFQKWLTEQDRSLDVTTMTQRTVEDYQNFLFDRGLAASTVQRDYRHMRQFFRFCVEDEAIEISPMHKMSPPAVPEKPVPVVTEEQRALLLKACEGTGFSERRDMALLRLMMSTGIRLGEVTAMKVQDVDLKADLAIVLGKGRRPRDVPIHPQTHDALRRYEKARSKHPKAELDALWLGRMGALTKSGIQQIVERRSRQMGIEPPIHPHQLRHTFAHNYMSNDGNETDLMMLAGWRSRTMLERYGKSAAMSRAIENSRKLNLD